MKPLLTFLSGGVVVGLLLGGLWWFMPASTSSICQQVKDLDERDHAVKSATIKTLMENYDQIIQQNKKLRLQLASLKPLDKLKAEVHQIHTLTKKTQPVEQTAKTKVQSNRALNWIYPITPQFKEE